MIVPQNGNLLTLPSYPWQREHFWSESDESKQERQRVFRHPFKGSAIDSPQPGWTVEINEQLFPFLLDHKLNERPVFPGAAYVEAGLVVFDEYIEGETKTLSDLRFDQMLVVDSKRIQQLGVILNSSENEFCVYSKTIESGNQWTLHASGKLETHKHHVEKEDTLDLACLRKKLFKQIDPEEMYSSLSKRSLNYGSSFRRAKEVYTNDSEILINIDEPSESQRRNSEYFIHPTILDTAIHSLLSLVPSNYPFVPVAIGEMEFRHGIESNCWCYGKVTDRTDKGFKADFSLFKESGEVLLVVKNIQYKEIIPSSSLDDGLLTHLVHELNWTEFEDDFNDKLFSKAIIFANGSNFSSKLVNFLQQKDITTSVVSFENEREPDKDAGLGILNNWKEEVEKSLTDFSDLDSTQIFYLSQSDPKNTDTSVEEICKECMMVIHLVQILQGINPNLVRLTLITYNGQFVNSSANEQNLNQSPLIGLSHVIENEHPNIICRFVDIDDTECHTYEDKQIELIVFSKCKDLVFSNGVPYYLQLKKLDPYAEKGNDLIKVDPSKAPLSIAFNKQKGPEELVYTTIDRCTPKSHEVEIAIDLATSERRMDIEEDVPTFETLVVGRITRTGDNGDFKVGDRVIVSDVGPFSNFKIQSCKRILNQPSSMSNEDSIRHMASVLVTYCLSTIANLKAGERLLICGIDDSLGLGLAAIQIAKRIGAAVIVIAKSQKESIISKELGADFIIEPENFTENENWYGKTNIDVVLDPDRNEDSLEWLKQASPYSRIVQIPKQKQNAINDILTKNISLSIVDPHRLFLDKLELIKSISKHTEDLSLEKIPINLLGPSKILKSRELRAQQESPGIPVCQFASETNHIDCSLGQESAVKGDGSYIVTGGTRGFGLQVAAWLAREGAGQIVLISRSGKIEEDEESVISEMRNMGIDVNIQAVDICHAGDLKKTIDSVSISGYRLRGILHGAMVLDDAYIKDMTVEKFIRVLKPKVEGALNLYRLTRDLNLDFMISFSSISSIVGNRAQANYIAANSFLDCFTDFARNRGYPASVINWGVLSEAGVVARNKELGLLLKKEGVDGILNKEAFAALKFVILNKKKNIGVFRVNWDHWALSNSAGSRSSRFESIIQTDNKNILQSHNHKLDNLSIEEREKIIKDSLRKHIAKVIKLTPNKIDLRKDLSSLGIDSLMTLELSLAIHEEFSVNIPTSDLFGLANILEISKKILSTIESN